ncbi:MULTISPECIES: hypothetical protein [unclassified Rickettsia]
MIKSRHDTAFFQRSYSSGLDHAIQKKLKSLTGCRGQAGVVAWIKFLMSF